MIPPVSNPNGAVALVVDLTKGRKKHFTGLVKGLDYYFYFSAGWLNHDPHVFQTPDFSGFTGWDNRWGFHQGLPVTVSHGQFGAFLDMSGGTGNPMPMRLGGDSAQTTILKAGQFRIMGLRVVAPGDSFSASRQQVSTP